METGPAKKKPRIMADGEYREVDQGLLADLVEMMNNADYSDIQFLCKDGVLVHASRLFLIKRSTWFKCLLTNGMAESRLSEIPMPDTSSKDLLLVFEFLYTGAAILEKVENWTDAFKLIFAAKQFCLSNLEHIVWEYLGRSSMHIWEHGELTEAAKNLSIAMNFKTLWENRDETVVNLLLDTLESSYDEPDYVSGLSVEGFIYYMTKTKVETEGNYFREFYRFKQVCLWLAHKISPEMVLRVTLEYLPMSTNVMYVVPNFYQMTFRSIATDFHEISQELLNWNATQSEKILVSAVNLKRIHPLLLEHLVIPKEMFPPSVVAEAREFHAQTREFNRINGNKQICRWENKYNSGKTDRMAGLHSYNTSPMQFTKFAPGVMFARSTTPMWPSRMYVWRVKVHMGCPEANDSNCYLELGFLGNKMAKTDSEKGRKSESIWSRDLSSQEGAWAIRFPRRGHPASKKAGADKWENFPKGEDYPVVPVPGVPRTDDEVKVLRATWSSKIDVVICLNTQNSTCRVTVNAVNLGVAWSDIPRGAYFPALSVHSQYKTALWIELIKGFDTELM